MSANRRITPSFISSLAGYLIIANVILSMTLSILLGNLGFSPFDYRVEDYGMKNGNGSIFYNAGIMVTGTLLCIFILGFYRWYSQNKLFNTVMITGQICGIIAGITLVLEGYTIHFHHMNPFIWMILFYIAVIIAIIMATANMLMRPDQHEDTIIIGAASITLIMLLAATTILNIAPVITEWLALSAIVIWLGLASRDMHKLSLS
ncbi:hypothetical protein [Methanocella sp. MCL-LM]|uniref:hypothetical protein n=1 Tax=Methanocella sp. MCL-LM TaxID=3412035 RepID=UPI003C78CF82